MSAPAYNYGNEPTAISVGGAASQQIFTAYQLAQDSPTHRKAIMDRHGMKKNLFAKLKELGLGTPLTGPTLGHYERDWIRNNFLIGGVVTPPGGAGLPAVYELGAGSMYTTNIPGIGAMSFSYPAVYDMVVLPSGNRAQIIAKDTTVTPHHITLQPELDTTDLTTEITAGLRYFIGDNALPEGSRSVAVKMPRYFKYTNDVQIIKSRFAETGSSMTNKLPFKPIEGMEGSFMVEGTSITEKLQMDRISKALLWGKRNNNLTGFSDALGFDVPIKTTQGLNDYIEQEGSVLTITPGATILDEFDAIGEILNRERVDSLTILGLLGYGLKNSFNNLLVDFVRDTAFTYAAGSFPRAGVFGEGIDAKDHFLWLDFVGIHKNSRNYLFSHTTELDEQMGAGTEGYNSSNSGYMIPIDSIENKGGANPHIPTLGYEYKALNGYSREWEMYPHGGAGPITKTTDLDAMNLEWRSEVGAHFGLGNQMIKLQP